MRSSLLGAGFASLAALAAFAPADMTTGGSGFATSKATHAAADMPGAGSTAEAAVADKTAGTTVIADASAGSTDPVTTKATKTGDTEAT